jgi:hypothetical protein
LAERETDPLNDARLEVRFAGYCAQCDRIVVRENDGTCPQGHLAESVAGKLVLVDGEMPAQLPRFNFAAFLLPFIWGPAHEEWIGAVFLPIWLFLDSIVATAQKGGVPGTLGAVIVVVVTLGFQGFFAKRANGVAYRRLIGRVTVAEYARRERLWLWGAIPGAVLLVTWMVWFHVAVAPTLPAQ